MDKTAPVTTLNGGVHAGRRLPASPHDPAIRRRNRRYGWILAVVALCCLCSSYYFVRQGWIRPAPVVWKFPWSQHAWKSNF